MADENKPAEDKPTEEKAPEAKAAEAKPAEAKPAEAKPAAAKPAAKPAPNSNVEEEHYEEVAEYRVGEGPPPLALIVVFFLIVTWAMTSWVPFFGY